jgi:hypothetical protein
VDEHHVLPEHGAQVHRPPRHLSRHSVDEHCDASCMHKQMNQRQLF